MSLELLHVWSLGEEKEGEESAERVFCKEINRGTLNFAGEGRNFAVTPIKQSFVLVIDEKIHLYLAPSNHSRR